MDGPPEKSLLTVATFAARSGLSQSTVRRYIRAGKLPSFQPGGQHSGVLIPETLLPTFDAPSAHTTTLG